NVGVRMPDLPAFAATQNVSTPTPMGDTIPSPVMTGWRFMERKSPRPRCFLVSPRIPALTLTRDRPNGQAIPAETARIGEPVTHVQAAPYASPVPDPFLGPSPGSGRPSVGPRTGGGPVPAGHLRGGRRNPVRDAQLPPGRDPHRIGRSGGGSLRRDDRRRGRWHRQPDRVQRRPAGGALGAARVALLLQRQGARVAV